MNAVCAGKIALRGLSLSMTALLVLSVFPQASFAQKTIDGDDDEWFMEETTPKDKKPVRPAHIPDSQANNLGVPMTEDGRIIPLKNDNTPIMGQGSQMEVTNEYIYQPGGYYPGMPQMNLPFGGVSPYYSPGVMPYGYRPGLNINLGRAGGINIGGNGYNPYGYGGYGNGFGTGYGTGFGGLGGMGAGFVSPYTPYGGVPMAPGFVPGYGSGLGGYGLPGVGGIGLPGAGGVNIPTFGLPGLRR